MVKIGIGYDIHPLTEGRPLVLGGVRIPHDRGLLGDSDADVLVHAVIDAILGAAGGGDIGVFFGVGEPRLAGIYSLSLLDEIRSALREKGLRINNIDATVIAEAPHLSPYLKEMKKNIANALGVEESQINIKTTTAKGLGVLGKGGGIAAQAVVSLLPEASIDPDPHR